MSLDALFPDSPPCDCEECKAMCKRPCWPTPEDAQAILDAGLGGRMMLDGWNPSEEHPKGILLLAPACPGHEGTNAPINPRKSCTFLNAEGQCELHSLGLKPKEGRAAHHASTYKGNIHLAVAESWIGEEGEEIVDRWCKERGVEKAHSHQVVDPFKAAMGALELIFEITKESKRLRGSNNEPKG